jgi:hypothetical protein
MEGVAETRASRRVYLNGVDGGDKLAVGGTERAVGGLLLILLVVGVTLTVLLWGGTVFLQGYYYTEASTDVFWQAPVAGAVLTLFFGLWCLLDYNAEGVGPDNLPYDTIFRFSPDETKYKKPVPHLWAVRKNEKEPLKYKRRTVDQEKYDYCVERDGQPDRNSPWRGTGVEAILIEDETQKGQKIRFDLVPTPEGGYRTFVDPEGWKIVEYPGGPTGEPTKSRTGLFFANLVLNLLHLGVWFGCLWLVLRFQWTHALGLAAVLWLVMTLTVLPMLLMRAGTVARESGPAQTPAPKAARQVGELLADGQRPAVGGLAAALADPVPGVT